MKRDEMSELRKELVARVGRMRAVGDWGAGAADIRENAEVLLKLVDHIMERLK